MTKLCQQSLSTLTCVHAWEQKHILFQISENTCISNLFLQSNSTAFVKAYDINYITLFFFYLKPGIGPSNDLSHRPSGSCRHHPSQRSKNGFDILYFYTKFKRPRFCLAQGVYAKSTQASCQVVRITSVLGLYPCNIDNAKSFILTIKIVKCTFIQIHRKI